MSQCDYARQVNAYYDGELSPEECRRLGEHIRQCAVCAEELGRLRGLSRLLATATPPEMSPVAMKRLHRSVGALSERMIVRTAEFSAALAAMALLVCLVGLSRVTAAGEVGAGLADWERIAVAQRPDVVVMATPAEQFAGWIMQDLSQGDGND